MASTIRTRNLMSGYEAVRFEGCDLDDEGRAAIETADHIRKEWGVTEAAAREKL
jgi:hypothetical protein